MVTLERLVEIEGRLVNERLLETNYDALNEETGQLCQDLVVEYISLAETVSDKDIYFIKNLTKVASHVMKLGEGSLDDFLERIYQFNMEGVEKVRGGIKGRNQDNLLRLESHLLAYAGDAAQALYEKTRDIEWAEKWYETYKLSADMTIDSEPKHSAHAFSFAGDAAKAIFEKTHDTSWAVKWYEGTKLSADMTIDSEPRHSAHAYTFAGDAAKAKFDVIKYRNDVLMEEKIEWVEKWYDAYKISADMTIDSDTRQSAHAYSFSGNAAKALFEETGQIEWGKKAIECYKQFTSYYDENPDSQRYKLIRSIKYRIYNLEGSIKLSEEASKIAKLF